MGESFNAYKGQTFGLKITRQPETMQDVMSEEYRRQYFNLKKIKENEES